MRRLVLALMVALGVVVLSPVQSDACSCATRTPAQEVRAARTVASGTVEWRTENDLTVTYSVRFDDVYKGSVATREKVLASLGGSACGLDLAVHERYLLFLDGTHPGAIRASGCGGASPYSAALAEQVRRLTGTPHQPPAGTEPAVVVRPDGASWWWPWATGAAAVAIGWIGIHLGRRRLRRTPGEIDARNR